MAERVQSRLRKQRRERQVREQCYPQCAYTLYTYGHLTIPLRLWEALGLTRAGFIPNAGRPRKEGGEE